MQGLYLLGGVSQIFAVDLFIELTQRTGSLRLFQPGLAETHRHIDVGNVANLGMLHVLDHLAVNSKVLVGFNVSKVIDQGGGNIGLVQLIHYLHGRQLLCPIVY